MFAYVCLLLGYFKLLEKRWENGFKLFLNAIGE